MLFCGNIADNEPVIDAILLAVGAKLIAGVVAVVGVNDVDRHGAESVHFVGGEPAEKGGGAGVDGVEEPFGRIGAGRYEVELSGVLLGVLLDGPGAVG